MTRARPTRSPLALALAAFGLAVALAGCTAPATDDAIPAPPPRPTPTSATAPSPVAVAPVEFGSGVVRSAGRGSPDVGRLTFVDRGPDGVDVRLTGLEDVPAGVGLVLLDQYEQKPGCLPDVFETSAWQPDLVPDGNGTRTVHIPREYDATNDYSAFPHALMIDRAEVDRLWAQDDFPACSWPVIAEAEMTWTAAR